MAKSFTFTEQHRKLLQRMTVGWGSDEFGAPEIDPKRPYGNSDVYRDMAEILGWPDDLSEDQIRQLDQLHSETQTALEILLQHGMVIPGEYVELHDYHRDWILEVDPRI